MATEPTIEQMNEAIALFMGFKIYDEGLTRCVVNDRGLGHPVCSLRYDDSWLWLMPVVEKIESLFEGNAFTVEIKGYWCLISQNTKHWRAFKATIDFESIQRKGSTKPEAVYKAVYQFIQWYNKNTNNNTIARNYE